MQCSCSKHLSIMCDEVMGKCANYWYRSMNKSAIIDYLRLRLRWNKLHRYKYIFIWIQIDFLINGNTMFKVVLLFQSGLLCLKRFDLKTTLTVVVSSNIFIKINRVIITTHNNNRQIGWNEFQILGCDFITNNNG